MSKIPEKCKIGKKKKELLKRKIGRKKAKIGSGLVVTKIQLIQFNRSIKHKMYVHQSYVFTEHKITSKNLTRPVKIRNFGAQNLTTF